MTEEACETGLEKSLAALQAAGFEAELFEDDDDEEYDDDAVDDVSVTSR